jgi:hypothetical protein
MHWLLILLIVCVALAALKFVVAGLALLLAISIVWGVYSRPARTLGILAFWLAVGVVTMHPLATLGVVALLGTLSILRGWIEPTPPEEPEPPRLPPPEV